MKEFDLEVAGDFISMASLLIHIKSKMLLPQHESLSSTSDIEDPRKELVSKLVEYQKYQEASRWFKDRPLLGRDMWKRGFREVWSDGESTIILDEGGLYALIGMYRKVLKKAKKAAHVVMEKSQSLASRILEIKHLLVVGRQTTLKEIMDVSEKSVPKFVITFMSVLELARLGFVRIFQNENYGALYVNPQREIEKEPGSYGA